SHWRREHCREKWKNADKFAPLIKSEKPSDWPNQKEIFKSWNSTEIEKLLKALADLPSWLAQTKIEGIFRAKNSIFAGNLASADPKNKNIILYDLAYETDNLPQALAHEISHLLYEELSFQDKNLIATKGGWHFRTKPGPDIEYIPPPKVISPDSKLSPDEDFANLIEIYIKDKNKIKNFNS